MIILAGFLISKFTHNLFIRPKIIKEPRVLPDVALDRPLLQKETFGKLKVN